MARILLVTYYYPPDRSVGSHRWPPMARWLRRLGHEVTVLTTAAFGRLPDDDPWVVRTGDLQGPGPLRTLLRRPPAPLTAGGAAETAPPAPALLSDGLVPDAHVGTWLPFVVPAMRRLIRERGIDCVITNSPVDSTHLAGLALPRGARRPAWVADLEDGWRFEPLRERWPTRAQDRLDAALERLVLTRPDGVVSISTPIARDAAARFGVRTAVVPNGWDPEAEGDVLGAVPPPLEVGVFNLVHVGGLSHPVRRDPRPLFEALHRLDEDVTARLRIVLAGGLNDVDRRLLGDLAPRVAAIVRPLGPLQRAAAIALQRAADGLLLINTGPQTGTVTGKLFEYLAARRPVLAISTENEAARIVRACGAGVVVAPDDPGTVAQALGAAVRDGIPYAPRDLERYSFPAVAEDMAAAVGAAVARRRAS